MRFRTKPTSVSDESICPCLWAAPQTERNRKNLCGGRRVAQALRDVALRRQAIAECEGV